MEKRLINYYRKSQEIPNFEVGDIVADKLTGETCCVAENYERYTPNMEVVYREFVRGSYFSFSKIPIIKYKTVKKYDYIPKCGSDYDEWLERFKKDISMKYQQDVGVGTLVRERGTDWIGIIIEKTDERFGEITVAGVDNKDRIVEYQKYPYQLTLYRN